MKKKENFIEEVIEYKLHHRIMFFLFFLIITILLLRTLILIKNPNPTILGFELHHFDYGIILLIITTLLMLFGNRQDKIYLALCGISMGLIIDDLGFIRSQIIDPPATTEVLIYSATLPFTIIASIIIVLAITIIWHLIKKRKQKNK